MEITKKSFNTIEMISVSGRIDSYTAPKLSEVLHSITEKDQYKIILNLDKVNYVSSAGLRIFIDIQKVCKITGKGETVLVSVPTRVYETLELAGFTPLFNFFENDIDAVNYFEGLSEK
jgi:anti-sigma B factor antagonist